MLYSTGVDPYLNPKTGIFINSLGIDTQTELDKAEADISSVVLAALPDNPITGDFDLLHLRAIHKALLGSLYTWAGQLRTVEMTKGTTRFANPEFLEKSASELFIELHNENFLCGLQYEQYLQRLAHYYSEVNILHPFREGNGRTQRTFFTLLAAKAGYIIKWNLMDIDENLEASISAYNGDELALTKMFAKIVDFKGN